MYTAKGYSICYWKKDREMEVSLNDKYDTTLNFYDNGDLDITIDGEYHGPSEYCVTIDQCELLNLFDLYRECKEGKTNENVDVAY